ENPDPRPPVRDSRGPAVEGPPSVDVGFGPASTGVHPLAIIRLGIGEPLADGRGRGEEEGGDDREGAVEEAGQNAVRKHRGDGPAGRAAVATDPALLEDRPRTVDRRCDHDLALSYAVTLKGDAPAGSSRGCASIAPCGPNVIDL